MATYTATGTGNWNAAATWGGAGFPIAGDTAIINNASYTVTLSAGAACLNLTVSAGTLNLDTRTLALGSGGSITGGGTITSSTGVITITTATVNCAGTKLDCIVQVSANGTITLTSKFLCTTFRILTVAYIYFTGNYDVECDNFYMALGTQAYVRVRLYAGRHLIVNTSISMTGTYDGSAELYSETSSSTIYLDYLGTIGNCRVCQALFTDVDASGSAQKIDNWYGSTLRTVNIYNKTSNDLNGFPRHRLVNGGAI